MENDRKLDDIEIINYEIENLKGIIKMTLIQNDLLNEDDLGYQKNCEFINKDKIRIRGLEQIKKSLEIAKIFRARMRILERDNYKVIKVDIFSDVPGFVEEYNKIIDWHGDSNE